MWYVILEKCGHKVVVPEEDLFKRLETMPGTIDGVSGGFLSPKAARAWVDEKIAEFSNGSLGLVLQSHSHDSLILWRDIENIKRGEIPVRSQSVGFEIRGEGEKS